MSVTHRSDSSLIPGYHHSGDRGLGVRGALIPSVGQHGPGFLFSGLSLPSENNDEFRIVVLTIPVGLESLFVNEDSSATTAPLTTGVYSGTYQAYKNGVSYGISTYTITVGDGLTGTIVFDPLEPSGGLSGTLPTIVVKAGSWFRYRSI